MPKPSNVNFNEEKYTLLLNVNKGDIDINNLKDLATQNDFDEKDDFHITIIGFMNGDEIGSILDRLPKEDKDYELLRVKSLINETDWSFELLPERYSISKDYPKLKEHREAYVQMINLQVIYEFYKKLNTVLETHLVPPLPHITLYTNGNDKEKAKIGIGINSRADLKKMNPEPI